MMKFSKFCFGVLVLLLASLGSMSGQSISTAQVSGVVQDQSGAVVPNAQVEMTKTDTGLVRKAVSGSNGEYIISDLPVGSYSIKATAQGFSTYVENGIVLEVSTNPEINVKLSVGEVTQQVVVEASGAARSRPRATASARSSIRSRSSSFP